MKRKIAITTKDFHYANELTAKLLKDENVEKILLIGKDLTVPKSEKITYIDTLPYFPLTNILKENDYIKDIEEGDENK